MTTEVNTEVTLLELTNEEYHARPEWSSTQVKLIPDEPWTFFKRHIEKDPAYQFNRTPSIKLGTAVHDIVLDGRPTKLIPGEALASDGSRRGNNWKAFQADNPGVVLCKADDPILHMVAAIREEPKARAWLDADGLTEQSMVYQDPVPGLGLRAQTDKLAYASGDAIVIADIKSTSKDPFDEREIAKQIVQFCYHRQAAWYWDAVDLWGSPDLYVQAFVFVFVQNTPPFGCHVHEIPERAIELGRQQNKAAIGELSGRLSSNNWRPATWGRVTLTDLPEWYYQKEGVDYGN